MQTKRLPFALLLVLLSAGTAASGETRFYGFIRFDAILDDSRLSHHQFPNWVLSEDPSKGKENDGHFGMHPRLTRKQKHGRQHQQRQTPSSDKSCS